MVNCRDSPSDSPDSWYNSRMTEILLVDDERSIRDSLSCQLREAGFTVRVAASVLSPNVASAMPLCVAEFRLCFPVRL